MSDKRFLEGSQVIHDTRDIISVSKQYLHRYLWQFDFLWNLRKMNDGERTIVAIKFAEGKRPMYKHPLAD